MAQKECKRCRGTGYASAARDSGTEDAHWTQVQYGVYQCPTCGGSGKTGLPDDWIAHLTPEEKASIDAAADRAFKSWKEREEARARMKQTPNV